MSGTIVTSAPSRSSSSASGFASGRVTTMRRPEKRLLSHGSPPVCGPRPPRAPRRASRSPSSARLALPVYAHHLALHRPTRRAPGDEPEGSWSVTASAATGAAQPPPSARRNARSAVVSARAAGSSSAARSASSASSSARHWIASAPCPGAGSIVSAREPLGHDALEPEPSRRRPLRARPRRTRRRATLRMRVSTFPRIERTSRSGRSARSCAARRRLLVPTTAPAGSSASEPAVAGDEAVADVLAAVHRADDDAGSILGREVLERVHGQVDLAGAQRALELGREEPLAADLGQRLAALLRPVAGRGDHSRRRTRAPAAPRPAASTTTLRLRARERRRPRAEGDRRRKRRGAHGSLGRGDAEQVAHRAGDLVRVAGAGALARAHGRVVQELLHERPGQVLDALGDGGIDLAEVAQRALDLALADRLGLPAQLRQERLDLELPIPAAEALDLLLDDRLDLRHLAEPRRHRVVEPGAQVVDVEEPDARDSSPPRARRQPGPRGRRRRAGALHGVPSQPKRHPRRRPASRTTSR